MSDGNGEGTQKNMLEDEGIYTSSASLVHYYISGYLKYIVSPYTIICLKNFSFFNILQMFSTEVCQL